ncbi:MAG: GNAT family N-acetyltransferase, partial [Flavobacteriaceae bacterium]
MDKIQGTMNPMENITIRPAQLGDLKVLLRFEQGIIEAERPYDTTIKPDPVSYYDLKEMMLSKEAAIVVAECAGQVVASGFVRIKEARPYLDHEKYAYLGFMYTEPSFRGSGINARIIDVLKDWALTKGLSEI